MNPSRGSSPGTLWAASRRSHSPGKTGKDPTTIFWGIPKLWHFNTFCNWQHSTCMHLSFFFEVLKSSIHGFFKGGYMGTANKNTYKNRWHMGRCGKERAAPDTCESILIQIDHLLRNRATPSSSALKLYTTELQNRQIEQVCGWSIVPQGLAIFQKMKIGVSQSSKCWFTSRIEQSNLLLDFCLRNNTSERFVIAAHVGSDYFKLTHNTEQNIWNTGPNK